MRSHFNLSQNKALRTLETTAKSISAAGDAAGFLKTVLSTIELPLPLDVVVVYREYQVGYGGWDQKTLVVDPLSAEQEARIVRQNSERFAVYREMYSVRDFRLVLCADVHERVEKSAIKILKRVVDKERRHGGISVNLLLHSALIISDRRTPHVRFCGSSAGATAKWPIPASAL